jgi:5-dehydro-2-deoxygluconokinase
MADRLPEMVVYGRVSYDLNPLRHETPLEDVDRFERSVGGFAGNVATGLARLGIQTLVITGVGDDPHGRYIRRWLEQEGVDVSGLVVHQSLRTALAFYESWPPDRFPITLFRSPTAPDWELTLDDLPLERIDAAPGLLVSGTALARPNSARTMRAVVERRRLTADGRLTIFDLDWRPMAWLDERDFVGLAQPIVEQSDVVVGGDAEFEAAGLSPDEVAADGRRLVVIKHGPDGATLLQGRERSRLPGIRVPVTVGLGAGDAFVAALAAGLIRGLDPGVAIQRANAAGAIVASRPMCSPAMPRPNEVDSLLASLDDSGTIAVSTPSGSSK